jgi:TRAP-type mannitol/chloroaromatic compound transport system permease small subunit
MQPKNLERSNNLFKHQFLMNLTYVLCKISVVEYSCRCFNWKILQYVYLGVIILICKKVCVVMQPKILKNSNNLFKQLFLMHLTYVLCKISVVKYSYQIFNYKIL